MEIDNFQVGWTDLTIHVGAPTDPDRETVAFAATLVFGSLNAPLAGFWHDLGAGRDAEMTLHHEPGKTVISARETDTDTGDGDGDTLLLEAVTTSPVHGTEKRLSVLCSRRGLHVAMRDSFPWIETHTPEPDLSPDPRYADTWLGRLLGLILPR